MKHSLGCFERIISIVVLRTSTSSGSRVVMSMLFSSAVQQALGNLVEFLTLTMHSPHAAVAGRSGCLHSTGIFTCTDRAASRMVVPSGTSTGYPSIVALTIFTSIMNEFP